MDAATLRKLAYIEQGRQVLEKTFGPPELELYPRIGLLKAAGADMELMKIAARLSTPETLLETYEALGGTYKTAGHGSVPVKGPALQRFMAGFGPEAGIGLGAALGAGLATAAGKNPLAGAALGSAVPSSLLLLK
jgi:hypothetical protein